MGLWTNLTRLSHEKGRDVYEATSPEGARVALKVLTGRGPQEIALFEREVRVLSRLKHKSLVPLIGFANQSGAIFGEDRGPAYWMEFVQGSNLLEAARKASVEQILAWFRQALEVLDYLHAQGLMHGDVSPKNILINEKGLLRLIDPSIGFLEEEIADLATLPYMAPERLDGLRLPGSDLFSLGTIFYEAFAGRHPRAASQDLQEMLSATPAPLIDAAPQLRATHALVGRIIDRMIVGDLSERLVRASSLLAMLKSDAWRESPGADGGEFYPARMVGREIQFEEVRRAVGNAVRASAVFTVHGETGVGKSRFLREAEIEARLKGVETSVFSDLEESTQEQKAALVGFLRRLEPTGRLVFLEWNDDILAPADRKFFQNLISSGLARDIRLGNLDAEQTFSLACSALGEARAKEATPNLQDQTGGNPAFVVEALRFLKGARAGRSKKLPPISRIEDALTLRLSRCTSAQRSLLNVIAAARDPVSWKHIALWSDEKDLDRNLRELANLNLVAEYQAHFGLTVPALEGLALRDLSQKDLSDLHRRWFQILGHEPADHPQRLHHALFLKKKQDVAIGAPVFGERLQDGRQFEECLELIARCLDVLDDDGDPAAVSRLLRLRQNALNALGRYREAIECADRWLSLNAPDEPETVRRIKYWVITGQGHQNLGEGPEAERRLLRALEEGRGRENDPSIRPWVLKAFVLLRRFEEALSLAPESGSQRAEIERNLGLFEAARLHYREARDTLGEFWALIQEGNLAVETKDLSAAASLYDAAEKIAEDAKSDLRLAIVWNNQGLLKRLQGDVEGSLAVLHRAREIFQILGNESDLAQNRREIEQTEAAVGKARSGEKLPERAERTFMESTLPLLTSLNEDLLREEDMGRVLNRLMDAAMRIAKAESGFLVLRSNAPDGPLPGYEVAVARNVAKEEIQTDVFAFSLSAVRRALQTDQAVVTDNALADPLFREARSVQLQGIKSIVALPVRGVQEILGVFYLDHRFQKGLFEGEPLELLRAFAGIAALALQKERMIGALKQANGELSARVESQASQVQRLEEELQHSRLILKNEYSEIIGRSPKMIEVLSMLDKITESKIPVWIFGESGTGKESVARALHFNSARAKKPFVTENCSALPESLLESELFGHKKGSFTHATADKKGILQYADGGTIFLDEIADMSLALQAKLLRFLQEGEIRPIGSPEVTRVDVRVVSASNKDLASLVREGKFREDLFYRLNGVTVRLPNLRDRKEDIPLLANHFLEKIAQRERKAACVLSPSALKLFMDYPWPGNIRELQNTLETAVLFTEEKEGRRVVTPQSLHFKPTLSEGKTLLKEIEAVRPKPSSLPPILEETLRAIRDQCFHKGRAAKALGISRRSLYARLERAGIGTDPEALRAQIDKFL